MQVETSSRICKWIFTVIKNKHICRNLVLWKTKIPRAGAPHHLGDKHFFLVVKSDYQMLVEKEHERLAMTVWGWQQPTQCTAKFIIGRTSWEPLHPSWACVFTSPGFLSVSLFVLFCFLNLFEILADIYWENDLYTLKSISRALWIV